MKITKQYKDGSQKVVIDPMEKMAVVMGLVHDYLMQMSPIGMASWIGAILDEWGENLKLDRKEIEAMLDTIKEVMVEVHNEAEKED